MAELNFEFIDDAAFDLGDPVDVPEGNQDEIDDEGGEKQTEDELNLEDELNTGEEDDLQNKDVDDDDDPASSNPYSSIAKDLSERGILSEIDDEITSAEDLLAAINKSIDGKLDERQKRIEQALENGVEVDEINGYEDAINYLNDLTEDAIRDESELGIEIRRQLIVQDLMNRGFSNDRIQRELKKSIDTGNDIEDAIEALKSNKDYFNKGYEAIIEQKRVAKEAQELAIKKQAKSIQEKILKTDTVFDGILVDQVMRKKAFDNIYKPVYTDPDTGRQLTAIQKYEKENKEEFMHNLAIIFTMTDGFKTMDKFIGKKVNAKSRQAMSRLEQTINGTSRNSAGRIDFAQGQNDPESFDGLQLDV